MRMARMIMKAYVHLLEEETDVCFVTSHVLLFTLSRKDWVINTC